MSQDEERRKSIETLVSDCIFAHQEAIIVRLIQQLESDYKDLARLATFGEYNSSWTHEDVLDYVTFNM